MLTQRENVEAILDGRQPDYYLDIMDALEFCPDPIILRDVCPQDGKPHKDSWGVTKVFRPKEPGEIPINNTEALKVVHDIENWRDEMVVPSLDDLDWSMAEEFAANAKRNEKMLCFFNTTGLFERAHFLMGMEDAFCAYLEEPEEMMEMLSVIKDYKIANIQMAKEHLNPDVIFYQDDWGSKQNLFLSPVTWREIIKPLQKEISDAIHECGMLYIHHSDCYCEPIVEDMVEIGVDVWQGVIPENPIPEIQQRTRDKCSRQLVMQGGIDAPAYGNTNLSEEQVRAGVRAEMDRCLAGGKFFMGCPGGRVYSEPNNEWVQDELRRYGRQYAIDHPIGAVLDDGFDFEIVESWYGDKDFLPVDNA